MGKQVQYDLEEATRQIAGQVARHADGQEQGVQLRAARNEELQREAEQY